MLHEGRAVRIKGQAAQADIFTCCKFSRDKHNLRPFHRFKVIQKLLVLKYAYAIHLFLFV